MRRLTLTIGGTLSAIFTLLLASASYAQTDHRNLEEGLPITVEDAYPTAYMNREFQFVTRYDRNSGKNLFRLNPRFEYGFARNWQARIEAPFLLGSGDKTGSGDTALEAFYNLNAESLASPAFAFSARAIFPSGRDSRGVDSEYKFLMTRTLGQAKNFDRLHLNVAYRVNAQPRGEERDGQFTGTLGYSRRLGPNYILVTDYVYQQERERGAKSQLLEAGVRYQYSPLTIFTVGAGAGLTRESPDFRITLGFQRALTF
jgi:hypothetical protein